MPLIDDVKTALRLKSAAFDSEINTIIDACKKDLSLAGVNVISEDDALTQRAIILYAKANFGGASEQAERYMQAYTSLKNSMALSGDYTAVTTDG